MPYKKISALRFSRSRQQGNLPLLHTGAREREREPSHATLGHLIHQTHPPPWAPSRSLFAKVRPNTSLACASAVRRGTLHTFAAPRPCQRVASFDDAPIRALDAKVASARARSATGWWLLGKAERAERNDDLLDTIHQADQGRVTRSAAKSHHPPPLIPPSTVHPPSFSTPAPQPR